MLKIAGGIILAIFLLAVFAGLVVAMFSGFRRSIPMGLLTVAVFGVIALALTTCIFG